MNIEKINYFKFDTDKNNPNVNKTHYEFKKIYNKYFKSDEYITQKDFNIRMDKVYSEYEKLGYRFYATPGFNSDCLAGAVDTKTGEFVDFYNGVKCEDLIKNMTPYKDEVTGVNYYIFGTETYIPKSERNKFDQKIDEILSEKGLSDVAPEGYISLDRAKIEFKSELSRYRELPDGTLIKYDISNGKMTFGTKPPITVDHNKGLQLIDYFMDKISKKIDFDINSEIYEISTYIKKENDEKTLRKNN